jgi:hypothetical protein
MTKKKNTVPVEPEPKVKPDAEVKTEAEVQSETDSKPAKSKEGKHPFRKRADEVFASHNKAVDEVYITADGTVFLQKQHARIHAESLKSDKIETLKREE